jgi:FkbM family methyltransferase
MKHWIGLLPLLLLSSCDRKEGTNPVPVPSASAAGSTHASVPGSTTAATSVPVPSSAGANPPSSVPSGARYLFVDGGAHIGETVLAFEKSKLFTKHPWSVVSFEPNPGLVPKIPKRPFLTVVEAAIWTKDGELEFHFSEHETLGGSVLDSYVPLPEMKAVKVRSVDFGRWLAKSYKKEDVVHVKFDIEGAEYPVLEQMLKDGTMSLVDKLYLEFHGDQQIAAAGGTAAARAAVQKKDWELVEAITGLGIAVSLHHNDEPQGQYFDFDPEKYGQPW